jgi:hypothetical protein
VFVVAFIFFAPITDDGTIGEQMIGFIAKGSRVGPDTTNQRINDNEVDVDPASLASDAGLDLDTYTLARMISSEEGNSSNIKQVAVAWVAKNNAQALGSSIFEYATDGSFGRQTGGIGSRPVSTWEDPYEGHVTIAKGVIAGTFADPTGGARHFVAPRTQDKLHAANPDKYKSYADVDASWQSGGSQKIVVDGIDPAILVFYT